MKETPQFVVGQSKDKTKTRDSEDRMKSRLVAYISLNKEIEDEIERLERVEDKLYGLRSPIISDMPKSPSRTGDKKADLVSRKIYLENRVKFLVESRDEERAAIEHLVRQLKKAGEKAVIRMRYLDLEEWSDVIFMLFGKKEDYLDKYDNYQQTMFRLHKSAISSLADVEERNKMK